MARATMSATALKQLIEEVEKIRNGTRVIDEKYGTSHRNYDGWEEDIDRQRNWYLRLIECGPKEISLEHEDWQAYFYNAGTDLAQYEKVAKENAEERKRQSIEIAAELEERRQREAIPDCPVFGTSDPVPNDFESPPSTWRKFLDGLTWGRGSGRG